MRYRLTFEVEAPRTLKLTWLLRAVERACDMQGCRVVGPVRFDRNPHLELVKTDDEKDGAA